jgi:hypothetical protein
MQTREICSAESNSAKPDGAASKTGSFRISQSLDDLGETTMTEVDDWRTLLIRYLENPGHISDRKVRRQALKYVVLDSTFNYQTIDGLLLKCLSSDQSKILMGLVHEGICDTHQSAHKMKWLLRHTGFHWPTMLNDCFRYYKGCESCQKWTMLNDWLLHLCCIL